MGKCLQYMLKIKIFLKDTLYFTLHNLCFTNTCGSTETESTCNAGDLGSIPGLEISPGGGKGYPLQYSGLENSMDCIVPGVTKSQTQLSNFHFTHTYMYIHPLTWGKTDTESQQCWFLGKKIRICLIYSVYSSSSEEWNVLQWRFIPL